MVVWFVAQKLTPRYKLAPFAPFASNKTRKHITKTYESDCYIIGWIMILSNNSSSRWCPEHVCNINISICNKKYFLWHSLTFDYVLLSLKLLRLVKVVKYIEMPKACPKKSMCHFRKLEMILKWNKQNTVRLPQKY